MWLCEDILEGQTVGPDPHRLWWKVPSLDNRLSFTALPLLASHKGGIIVKGNNFCIALTEQQQMPGKLRCESCKWYKKHWKMSCLLKTVDAWVFGGVEGKGIIFSLYFGFLWALSFKWLQGLLCLYLGRTKPAAAGMHEVCQHPQTWHIYMYWYVGGIPVT